MHIMYIPMRGAVQKTLTFLADMVFGGGGIPCPSLKKVYFLGGKNACIYKEKNAKDIILFWIVSLSTL